LAATQIQSENSENKNQLNLIYKSSKLSKKNRSNLL
jgi:hypothetical protein